MEAGRQHIALPDASDDIDVRHDEVPLAVINPAQQSPLQYQHDLAAPSPYACIGTSRYDLMQLGERAHRY